MAGGDERLPTATRNYVIFGVLLVAGLALAVREQFAPHRGRGESDSGLRVMVLGGNPQIVDALDAVDGFSVSSIEPAVAVAAGRELLGEDELPPYAAAIAHADQLGYGFVVFGLEAHTDTPAFAWGFDVDADPGIESLPPAGQPYLVFSVGDLAPEGPRAHWVELADLDYADSVRATDSVRLGLYEHPDFREMWAREGAAHELQARQVLSNRGLPERREGLLADQAHWRELDALWPGPDTIPNSLARPWEQARAAPVHGGVLLEVSPVRMSVDAYRRLELRVQPEAQLYFVSRAQLEQRGAGQAPERGRCQGLPEQFHGEIVVSPDGASLALRDQQHKRVEVFALDPAAATTGECRVVQNHVLTDYGSSLGRPNTAGRVAWTDDDFLVWHEGPGTTSFSPHVSGLGDYSGPWWADDQLLAMVAERELEGPDYAIDVGLVLFDTRRPKDAHGIPLDHEWTQTTLSSTELFGGPGPGEALDRPAPHRRLLDLRPAGSDQLYLLSEGCEDAPPRDQRPCLHRLRSATSLTSFVAARAAWEQALREAATLAEASDDAPPSDAAPPAPDFELDALGPIGPYISLSVAAEGKRAAWVGVVGSEQERGLFHMDLQGPRALESVRVDDDLLNDDLPRLGADGRVLVSSVRVQIGAEDEALGKIEIARAFLLAPPADTPPSPAAAAAPASAQPASPQPTPATAQPPSEVTP